MQQPITSIKFNPNMLHTDARVNMKTGEMQVNQDFMNLDFPSKMFILCHEYAHRKLNTKDEHLADKQAFEWYAAMGYPISEAVKTLCKVLNENSPFHVSRANAVYRQAKAFNESVYLPYQHQFDLSKQSERLKAMRKHNNQFMREVGQALRRKDFIQAQKLIKDKANTIENPYAERSVGCLKAAVDKVVRGNSLPKPNQRLLLGFGDDEDFAGFQDELAEIGGDIVEASNFEDELAGIADDYQGFTDEDFTDFASEDYADWCGISDDLAELTGETSKEVNPYEWANNRADRKQRRAARKDARAAKKQARVERKNKLTDAKVAVKMAKAESKIIRANAKQTEADAKKALADQGIGGGDGFDAKSLVNAGAGLLGAGLNAGTGGALKMAGDMLGGGGGGEGEGTGSDGTANARILPQELEKTPPPDKKGVPTWVWIVASAVVVIGIGVGVYFMTRPKGKASAKK